MGKKVAFLSFFNGVYERGVETLVLQLGKRLAEKSDLVVYQSGKKINNYYKTRVIEVEEGLSLGESSGFKRRLFLDSTSLAIKKFTEKLIPDLRKEGFDIIVPWNNGWETILCRLNNLAKIVTVGQAGIGWDDRVNLWSFPAAFVGFTDFQCNWARGVNRFVRVEKIPNGVDLSIFKPAGSKIKIHLERPVILSAAALVPMKRHGLAIKAMSKLNKGSLLIVGKGQEKEKLEKMGNELLPGRFKLMSLPFGEIPGIYRSADLLTFPTSAWESFGLVLLEAMASGLPVVATDDPIRREIVGEAGLFVDPTDTEKYAKTLEEALKMKWGDKPRKQAKKFDWDKIAKKYEELFLELLK